MHPSLRGYVTAVIGDGTADGAMIAEELSAVANLVARAGDLSVVLTDFAVPVNARCDVLEELLQNRVDVLTLRVVLHAVRTEHADELQTALHDVYELARHLNDLGVGGVRSEERPLGRTAWRHFAKGFSSALFENLSTTEIEGVEDEVFRFARIVEASPSLRTALADPTRPAAMRLALLDELLTGKVSATTLRLTSLLVEGHVRDVVASLDWVVELAARARGWRVARVRTAWPIAEQEQRVLAQAMEHLTHNPVELQVTADPGLLGGAVIQIGDLLVDASARHRLEQLHEHLLGTEGTTRGAQN